MDADAVLGALDEQQRRAATSPAQPLAVLAPAGSGKTRVLTARVVNRIATGDAEPAHILCVTFTRKAADELQGRLRRTGLHDRVEAGTFHGIAWRQLQDRWAAMGRTAPALLDRMRPFIIEQVDAKATLKDIADLSGEIAWARAQMLRPEQYVEAANAAGRRVKRPADWIAERFATYETAKTRRHVVDFDDLLAACVSAIEGDAAFAAAQRWRFRHLFVDEFQDVNPLQFRLLNAWRGDRWDVFVVGDSHQSIYGWNGADPNLLTSLADEWPALETIHLDRTHRSTPQITAAAASVIHAAGLPHRHPDATGSPGPIPRVAAYDDDRAEVAGVATAIRRRRAPDMPWSSFAVLARTHAQMVELDRGLAATGIPTRLRRQSAIMDDVLVRRILGRLSRDERPLLVAFGDVVTDADRANPALTQLLDVGDAQVELDPTITGREFVGFAYARLSDDERPVDAVTLSTIHAAKGLEWPIVHITGCENGSIPHISARRREAKAEEARLLYVAITRAEREVHLHWARHRIIAGIQRDRDRSDFLRGFEDAVGEAPPPEVGTGASQIRAVRRQIQPVPLHDPLVLALQAWRSARARAARTAPAVVLDDASLHAIAHARPSTADDLSSVTGIGAARAHRYGAELLAIVAKNRDPA